MSSCCCGEWHAVITIPDSSPSRNTVYVEDVVLSDEFSVSFEWTPEPGARARVLLACLRSVSLKPGVPFCTLGTRSSVMYLWNQELRSMPFEPGVPLRTFGTRSSTLCLRNQPRVPPCTEAIRSYILYFWNQDCVLKGRHNFF